MFEKLDLLGSPSSPSCPLSTVVAPSVSPSLKEAAVAEESHTLLTTNKKATKLLHQSLRRGLKKKKLLQLNSLSTCHKRLRKKAKLQQQHHKAFNLNKYLNTENKYNSLSSSSSSSSLSSSTSSFSFSSAPISRSKDQTRTEKPAQQQQQPMKLHKFYHSVPFKCPFCFTFKESPTDFIDHLATSHYTDVKLLYEKKCSKIIEALNEKQKLADELAVKEEQAADEAVKSHSDVPVKHVEASLPVNESSKPMQTLIGANESKLSSIYSSLPPRKQPRLLKSPLNDANDMQQQSTPWPVANMSPVAKPEPNEQTSYYNYYYSKHAGAPPSALEQSKSIELFSPQLQHNANSKNLILAAAAAASMLNPNAAFNAKAYQGNANKFANSSNMGNANAATEASMKCAICDRGFEYYSNLRRHIKTKHKIFGKQVKEYVIRQNFVSNNGGAAANGAMQSRHKSNSDLLNKTNESGGEHAPSNASPCRLSSSPSTPVHNSNSLVLNNFNKFNAADTFQTTASSIMMMSPQSSGKKIFGNKYFCSNNLNFNFFFKRPTRILRTITWTWV